MLDVFKRRLWFELECSHPRAWFPNQPLAHLIAANEVLLVHLQPYDKTNAQTGDKMLNFRRLVMQSSLTVPLRVWPLECTGADTEDIGAQGRRVWPHLPSLELRDQTVGGNVHLSAKAAKQVLRELTAFPWK